MKEKKEKTASKEAKMATIGKIVDAYALVKDAKLTKMETAERFALILATRQLKKVATDFSDLQTDTIAKFKPDGMDAIIEKIQNGDPLTADEAKAFNKFDRDVKKCLDTEKKKETALDFEPLTDEALGNFLGSNDLTTEQSITVMDILGK